MSKIRTRWWKRSAMREAIEATKAALIDNIELTRNPQVIVPVHETSLERQRIDHLRIRCRDCFELTGSNKHSAVLVTEDLHLCWCCWFDQAFYGDVESVSRTADYHAYWNSISRARRRALCSQVQVFGTTGLGDAYANYIRSHEFIDDVMVDRMRRMLGG